MWALRRASTPLRNQGFRVGTSFACAKLDMPNAHIEEKADGMDSLRAVSNEFLHLRRFYRSANASSRLCAGRRSLSSQAGAKSSGLEDDLEDGFSELETPLSSESTQLSKSDDESEDELISGLGLSDDDAEESDEMDLLETESDAVEKKSMKRRSPSALFKAIVESPGLSIHTALDKWIEEGKTLSRAEIAHAMLLLRQRKMFGRALQMSEWLEENKQLDFVDRDYASRLDLIAKVRGLHKAENYIENIPKSFRGEVIYRTLLANCVMANNVHKAECVFNKMKDLELPVTAFACNQLLLLYKRLDKKKISDVLLLMEKENVEPTQFTFKILIDAKGHANDISGMEKVVETMKDKGIKPDITTEAIIARHYISSGLTEKAQVVLKGIEGDDLKGNRWACRILLPLYADLGMTEEVDRIWKVCESSPRFEECMAAVIAWGKLKNVEKAEELFDKIVKTWKKLSSSNYSIMLKVYADNKMLTKGKDLIKRMADNGVKIVPFTWDALVKLYVEAGEVEKADSFLQKATHQNQMKPMFSSYMAIMEQYSKRGDVHNAEKIFYRMRQYGYTARFRQFQALLQAYINAKVPAYGFRERMKADNVFPNRSLSGQLVQVDAFRKTAVSDLLD